MLGAGSVHARCMTTRLTLVAAARQLGAPAAFPADGPVDDALVARAESLAARLPAGLAGWCGSDRASRETAGALGVDVVPADALGPWRYGAWAGRAFAEIGDDLAPFAVDVTARPPGGEAFTDVYARVTGWFATQAFAEQHHAVVATAPVVRALVATAIGAGAEVAARVDVGPLTRVRLHRHGATWRLRALGRA
jgi:broad specificity phosphatase PhoE